MDKFGRVNLEKSEAKYNCEAAVNSALVSLSLRSAIGGEAIFSVFFIKYRCGRKDCFVVSLWLIPRNDHVLSVATVQLPNL